MQLDHLRQSLFGYKKSDVCQYIASLEEDYSRQLTELEQAAQIQEAEYQARIHALEQELLESRQCCECQRQARLRISSILQEFQPDAEVLHKETERTGQTDVLLRQKDICPDRHMALFERTCDLDSNFQE